VESVWQHLGSSLVLSGIFVAAPGVTRCLVEYVWQHVGSSVVLSGVCVAVPGLISDVE
jgi:hypothetical protein